MARQRKSIPSYLPHSQSGRARAVWTDPAGQRQFRLLSGAYDSPESRSAFAALLLELQAAPHQVQAPPAEVLTLASMLVMYLDHAEQHYRTPDGQPTSEVYEVKIVLRALRELYADMPVAEFGPLCVKAARQKWVNDGRSRSECNRRVALIKRMFKWAVSEELVSPLVYQGVASVAGLQKGRTAARETDPIRPVDDDVVDATLPYLDRHVRGLVEFQRLTGCRPGEACAARRCDLDMSGRLWLYKPPHHKTAHRGKDRTIVLGPKAQELVREFFTPVLDDYLFSPVRAAEERRAERAAKRKSKRQPSQVTRDARRRSSPKRYYRVRYDRGSYGLAIDRACAKAFPLPGDLAPRKRESRKAWWDRLTAEERAAVKMWRAEHTWHPNQLRHSYATRVRKEYGLEAAQVLLGHSQADVTQVYAERNHDLAAMVAAKIG